MYVRLLDGDLPDDVEKVFTKLMEASQDSHLPAFKNVWRRRNDGTHACPRDRDRPAPSSRHYEPHKRGTGGPAAGAGRR